MDKRGDGVQPPEGRHRLDVPRHVRRLRTALYVLCGLLFLADFFYDKHAHFFFEDWFGFFAWFSFISCVVLVLAAKSMRRFLKRDEDYYD